MHGTKHNPLGSLTRRGGAPIRLAAMTIFTLLLSQVGCGSGEQYAPVTGTVTLDGEPLADAKLIFEPIGDSEGVAAGKPSYGRTGSDGRYSLRCPTADRQGAAVGQHRVRIVTASAPTYTEAQKAWARQFLEQQEKAGGNANPEITDEMVSDYLSDRVLPTFKEILPAKYNSETELQVDVASQGENQADFALESS